MAKEKLTNLNIELNKCQDELKVLFQKYKNLQQLLNSAPSRVQNEEDENRLKVLKKQLKFQDQTDYTIPPNIYEELLLKIESSQIITNNVLNTFSPEIFYIFFSDNENVQQASTAKKEVDEKLLEFEKKLNDAKNDKKTLTKIINLNLLSYSDFGQVLVSSNTNAMDIINAAFELDNKEQINNLLHIAIKSKYGARAALYIINKDKSVITTEIFKAAINNLSYIHEGALLQIVECSPPTTEWFGIVLNTPLAYNDNKRPYNYLEYCDYMYSKFDYREREMLKTEYFNKKHVLVRKMLVQLSPELITEDLLSKALNSNNKWICKEIINVNPDLKEYIYKEIVVNNGGFTVQALKMGLSYQLSEIVFRILEQKPELLDMVDSNEIINFTKEYDLKKLYEVNPNLITPEYLEPELANITFSFNSIVEVITNYPKIINLKLVCLALNHMHTMSLSHELIPELINKMFEIKPEIVNESTPRVLPTYYIHSTICKKPEVATENTLVKHMSLPVAKSIMENNINITKNIVIATLKIQDAKDIAYDMLKLKPALLQGEELLELAKQTLSSQQIQEIQNSVNEDMLNNVLNNNNDIHDQINISNENNIEEEQLVVGVVQDNHL